MRKRLIGSSGETTHTSNEGWLDLERIATVEITSEDVAHPIESALASGTVAGRSGWRAAGPGPQLVRIRFDEPQRLRRIWLCVVDPVNERTQELVLRWSADDGQTFRDVVRQQWNFSAPAATSEIEDYRVDLVGVTVLELAFTPDMSGGPAPASLQQLRVA